MGLFGFGKKKESDLSLPSVGSIGSGNDLLNTDLPSIDGDSLDNSNQLPSLDTDDSQNISQSSPQSISINVPTLDFSLPPSDEIRPAQEQKPETRVLEAPQPVQTAYIDEEDLNRLFPNDDSWKEPDWNNFEPYTEEKIEEPKSEDFNLKNEDLPTFDDAPVAEPEEPFFEKSHNTERPVELFIRGRAYDRVFVELDQMNKSLSRIDSQSGTYEDLIKHEEPLMLSAKEQMEYLYRKLNGLDKKIFVQ